MKKIIGIILAVITVVACVLAFAACDTKGTIYVDTNAFFAPFEYYEGTKIVGVDVDIMKLVGEKLDKKVVFENTDFGVIIDNVKSGKQYDCGAAGITITPERAELVDFSKPYFTSIQYVVFKGTTFTADGTTADGVDYLLWSSLAGMDIGVQTDTTGDIYVDLEINGDDTGYTGELAETGAVEHRYDNAQLACDALGLNVDAVVVDKLPAEYIVAKNSGLKCLALYYDATTATSEDYAICVTKGNTELLNAINEVLDELGTDGINALVAKHLGIN